MNASSKLLLAGSLVVVLASTTAGSFVRCTPEAVCVPGDAAAPARQDGKRELVVLVHGLGRTRLSMVPLARALERQGYDVLAWGYSSTSKSIPEIGRELSDRIQTLPGPAPERIHFVGHSLGNIVVRWVIANDRPGNLGRVVMLAPPNQGSHSADRYTPWLGWLLKPLAELRTAEGSTARTIPLPDGVEVGVIAGRYDGKVSVAETRLAAARAHVVVPAAHTFIMNRRDVRDLTVRFLGTGKFSDAPAERP